MFGTFWMIPLTTIKKIKMFAAKTHGAKSTGLDKVWNLFYLHEYVHDIAIENLSFYEATLNLVTKLRGALGWRSADIHGIFLDLSFREPDLKLSHIAWSLHSCIRHQNEQRVVDKLHLRSSTEAKMEKSLSSPCD